MMSRKELPRKNRDDFKRLLMYYLSARNNSPFIALTDGSLQSTTFKGEQGLSQDRRRNKA